MTEDVKRRVLRAKYQGLLSKAKNNEIHTFEMCSNEGCGVDNSTIDKVEMTLDGRIRFYYNENTGDYVDFDHLETDDMEEFLDNIIEYRENESQERYEETLVELSHQLYNHIYKRNEDTFATISEIKRLAEEFEKYWDSGERDDDDFLLEIDKFCSDYMTVNS